MKLYFRFLTLLIRLLFFKTKIDPHKLMTRSFRVWPTDLDINWHLTNSRYMALLDLVRIEFMMRVGVFGLALRKKYTPVLSSAYLRYRREFRLWDKMDIQLGLCYVDDQWFYLEYKFINDGFVYCHVIEKAGFHMKGKGMANPFELAEEAGQTLDPIEMPDHIEHWMVADREFSQHARNDRFAA